MTTWWGWGSRTFTCGTTNGMDAGGKKKRGHQLLMGYNMRKLLRVVSVWNLQQITSGNQSYGIQSRLYIVYSISEWIYSLNMKFFSPSLSVYAAAALSTDPEAKSARITISAGTPAAAASTIVLPQKIFCHSWKYFCAFRHEEQFNVCCS